MKPKQIILLLLAVLITISIFSGCSDGNTDNGVGEIPEDLFLDALEESLPVFSESRAAAWDFGNQIFELYAILRSGADVGGYFNMYSAMETADDYFSELSTQATAISLQTINLPDGFTTGISEDDSKYNLYTEYNVSGDGKSSRTFGRIEDDIYYMLVVARNTNGGENSNSLMQGKYNDATGEISIETVYSTGSDGSYEKVRASVTGNAVDHQFRLKIIRDGAGYDYNIIGYGISQGTGKFLLKMSQNSLDISGAKYYAFDAAHLTATDLQSMDVDGSDTDTLDTGYTDEVAAITAFTVSDLPTDTESDINIFELVTY